MLTITVELQPKEAKRFNTFVQLFGNNTNSSLFSR